MAAQKRGLNDVDDSDVDEDIEIPDDDVESFSYVPLKLRRAKEKEDAKNKLKHLLSGSFSFDNDFSFLPFLFPCFYSWFYLSFFHSCIFKNFTSMHV